MDNKAIELVSNYAREHFECPKEFDIYIVWKCKTLQNWKYLISTDMSDGMYYEVTFNGDKNEWYLDAYKKAGNVVIKG